MEEPLMQFFESDHLPEPLRQIVAPFRSLAEHIIATLPRNSERTVALRKLKESKDAAVCAKIMRPTAPSVP